MPKILEDIKIKKGDSAQSLNPILNIRRDDIAVNTKKSKEKEQPELPRRVTRTPRLPRRPTAIRRSIVIVFITALFLGGVFFIGNHFAKVTITIVQKHQTVPVDKEIKISKQSDTPVHFEVMILTDKEEREVTLTEKKDLSVKAHGRVTIYNTYSTKAEKFAAGSFLADEEGKAYKLDKAVTVPGYTTVKAKVVPGSVSADVSAFLPGEKYNGAPRKLTFTSLKNTPKFAKIYSVPQTAMSGGVLGSVYIVGNDARVKGLIEDLKTGSSIKDELMKKVEVPEGYMLYPSATTYSSTVESDVTSVTPNAKIAINSTLSAILLKSDDLSRYLIRNAIAGISSRELAEVDVRNLDSLNFSFSNPSQSITKDLSEVSFRMSGDLDMLWTPDVESLKVLLRGVEKSSILSILKQDPGIMSAHATVFPIWMRTLPSDVSRITTSFGSTK
jgi:hypothetical protein